jgi:hypothetical protein
MNEHTTIAMSLHVAVEDEPTAMKVWEVLTRAAAGLGLDGTRASVHIDRFEHDHDMDEAES